MGVDIHLNIIKDGKYIAKEIFGGRNSEWFDNLSGHTSDICYDYLPNHYGTPDNVPEDFSEYNEGCYGHCYMTVGDFIHWFITYNPHMDAGWVTTREKWLYDAKKIEPELLYALSKDDVIEDMHFIKIVNENDCSLWLFNYLSKHKIDKNAIITYCFDR